jgi:hypothetical protein
MKLHPEGEGQRTPHGLRRALWSWQEDTGASAEEKYTTCLFKTKSI